MRKFLTSLAILGFFMFAGGVYAQGNGNGNGNPGNGNHHQGLGNGNIEMPVVVNVLQAAQPHFDANMPGGVSLGQLIQKYHRCECTIVRLDEKRFRVGVDGGGTVIVLIDAF